MPCFVGLDASKRTTSICVLDTNGATLLEGTVPTDPKSIVGFLRGENLRYSRVGLEAWTLAPWLYVGLAKAGLPVICIEARHAHGILKARANKTDRNDARGIAEIMRAGTFRQVHIKSPEMRNARVLLTARAHLVRTIRNVDNLITGILLGSGLKVDPRRPLTYEARIKALVRRKGFLASVIKPLLAVRAKTVAEMKAFERRLEQAAAEDPVCRRLMTVPGVGKLTALIYRSAVDEPARFRQSRTVGAHFGLTPRVHQSGETEWRGGITRFGDNAVRKALAIAAWSLLRRSTRPSWLGEWGKSVRERRGGAKAMTAVARRLAVILHKIWITDSVFRWEAKVA